MVAGTLTKETAQWAGAIFLTMGSIFQPPALGHFKIHIQFHCKKGCCLAVKLGSFLKLKKNYEVTN